MNKFCIYLKTEKKNFKMDLERNSNDIDDIVAELDGDIDKVDGEIDAVGIANLNKKPAVPEERGKKKNKKVARQNSKEAALGVSGAPNFVAPQRRWKNSRRSRNGYGRGLPKKGGAGGKGVWGKIGSELLEEYEIDQDDPNYDADTFNNVELKEIIPEMTLEEFTKKFEPLILEYYDHGDTHEVAESLDEFLVGSMRSVVTKIAIEIAMEHKQSHREMTSVLISDLYGRCITSKDIVRGFDLLLDDLPDLILDTPDAPHVLGNFLARAVADDCIPPRYVQKPEDIEKLNEHARTALIHANTHLSLQAGWAHLDDVWGVGGALRPVKVITNQIHLLLQEYILSRDIDEAHRCITQLEAPHFHHELVYEVSFPFTYIYI